MSIPLLFTLDMKVYPLHKNDRSLVHRFPDAVNPVAKMTRQTVIKIILRKSTLPVLIFLIIGSHRIAIGKLFVKTKNTKSSPIFSKTYFDNVLNQFLLFF